jgi:anti-anti-sigma factor
MTSHFAVSKYVEAGGVAWLAVHGEIDTDVSEALTAIIANAARQGGVTALLIDLGDVPFLAAAGIRALLEGRATAQQQGLHYQVVNPHGIVRAVLRAAGLTELLRVADLPHHPAHRPAWTGDRLSRS